MNMAPVSDYLETSYLQAAKLFTSGKMQKAETACAKILRTNPQHAATQHLLATILYKKGDPVSALKHAQKATKYQQNSVNFLSTCAQIQMRMALYEDALQTLHQALKLEPDSTNLLSYQAEIFRLTGNSRKAMQIVKQALSFSPQNPKLLIQAGDIFYELGQTKSALSSYQLALSADPNNVTAYTKFGMVLQSLGDYKFAEDCFNMAIKIDPECVLPFVLLARQNKMAANDPKFLQLERLKNSKKMPLADQIHVRFALGKMYTDCEQYDRSFENYADGNRLRDNSLSSNQALAEFEQTVNMLMETCTGQFFTERSNWGLQSALPVFVLGMPRSGTTLVETILACHPKVYGAGELTHMPNLVQGLFGNATNAQQAGKIRSLDANTISRTANIYNQHLQSLSPDSTRIIDKLPNNFMRIWLISLLYPQAKFIHIKRNPLDTCLSCYFVNFQQSHAYSSDLAILGKYYKLYEKVMNHWQQTAPLDLLEVEYEDLVVNQEATSKKMVEFLNLDWHPDCLDFHKSRRSVLTASNVQVGHKMYSSSVERWRHYEKHLGPLLAELS